MDLIERQKAIDALHMHLMYRMGTDSNKKRLDDWINSLPSAQETHEKRTETHACDLIDRQVAIDVILADKIDAISLKVMTALGDGRLALTLNDACDRHIRAIEHLPSAEPDVIHCEDCRYRKYDALFDQSWCGYLWGRRVVETDYCSRAERKCDG